MNTECAVRSESGQEEVDKGMLMCGLLLGWVPHVPLSNCVGCVLENSQ